MNELADRVCAVCGSRDLELFFEMLDVPVYCNLLWTEREAARNCPKGDIKLAFCHSCGFITNVAFDPAKLGYNRDYENSLHYSPRFQQYADSLAADLVERHHLYNKDIIEIGCGKGDFLISLCELGNNRGIGFDPSYVPRKEHDPLADRVKFIQDYYSQQYKNYQADLIVCRHTLEHVTNPADLLEPLRQAIGDRLDTPVFFEVPNALYTFRHLAIWDIIYEHCSYFVPTSLKQTFSHCGFVPQEVREVFDGQFICLESLPANGQIASSDRADEIEVLSKDIANFKTKFDALVETWREKLGKMARLGQKVVIWGTGSKGVTFLNLLNVGNAIEYAVDINPRKQGMYVAGEGQQIVSPEFLRSDRPDIVIVMNPIYEREIQQAIADLGCDAETICV